MLRVAVLAILFVTSCKRQQAAAPTALTPEQYRRMVSAFYVGVVALEVDDNPRAKERLTEATQIAPQEPAAWADLGLYYLREGKFELAAQNLDKALLLAPDSAAVEVLYGLLESRRGDFDKAIARLQSAIQHDPKNLRARYALATALERRGGEGAGPQVRQQLDELLKLRPANLAVLVESARLAARSGDIPAVRSLLDRVAAVSANFPPDAKKQLAEAQQAAKAGNAQLATKVIYLQNSLRPWAQFRRDVAEVDNPDTNVSPPIQRFIKLPTPSGDPAAQDEAVGLTQSPLPVGAAGWACAKPAWLTIGGPAVAFVANAREVRRADGQGASIPFPGGSGAAPPTPEGLLSIDWRNDFKSGLVLAGAGGVRLIQQKDDGSIGNDVTASAISDAAVRDGDYVGAWAADLDLDGDLDIVLAARKGEPMVLRNNGDGTFAVMRPFGGVSGLRQFVWADLDGDGVPDACLLDDAGNLTVLANDRSMRFHGRRIPADVKNVVSIAAADLTRRGMLDLVALLADGTVMRIFDDGSEELRSVIVAKSAPLPGDAKNLRLTIADVDNNGADDLIISGDKGSIVLLGSPQGQYVKAAQTMDARVISAVADPGEPAGLALLGVTAGGAAVKIVPKPTRLYHYQIVRPRANVGAVKELPGSRNKINSFAIGGELELRAALLYQKQPITAGAAHFGLGENSGTDAIRVLWPNGNVQGEFDLKGDAMFTADQRLKGSCPMLFAFDGHGMQFVTDCIWRSPLGLRINAQATAQTMQTEDWVKVRGDQLAATPDGQYNLRITAELWETHYLDYASLMAVDHPAGTEVYIDERFAPKQPPLKIFVTSPPKPFACAMDDKGIDVSEIVRARDGKHLGGFALGEYQGVAADHFVELELPTDAPTDQPVALVGFGWIHPTDSSINVAMSQGKHPLPSGLVMEVADGKGGWRAAKADLGFPSGKNKTVVLPLQGVFTPNAPRRLRLRTNLEVYWDQLAWAVLLDEHLASTQRLRQTEAQLHCRGFSMIAAPDATSPEVPHYDHMIGASPRWRDLEGYYTRYGDVRELLEKVDDRYVIMNAGDELALRFAASPAKPQAVRDFVMIVDGWEKDGDYNTDFCRTVLPLPRHDWPAYDAITQRLEDDPAYQRHPQDWVNFHTRYVTPQMFQEALIPRK